MRTCFAASWWEKRASHSGIPQEAGYYPQLRDDQRAALLGLRFCRRQIRGRDAPSADYRNRWIDAFIAPAKFKLFVTFGLMGRKAWEVWKATPAGAAASPVVAHLTHPTQPESAGNTKIEREQFTAKLLEEWNRGLSALRPGISSPDEPIPATQYGSAFTDDDKTDIPSFDLPAGTPPWMYDNDGWATRGFPSKLPSPKTDAEQLLLKRSVIVVKVPKGIIP